MINSDITEYLRGVAGRRFRPGAVDCGLFVADWVWHCTGADPAAALRGTYSTDFGWRRIVAEAGGMVALVERLAARAGLPRTDDPLPGDVGVVRMVGTSIAPVEVGAVRVRRGWAALAVEGILVEPADALAAWRVPAGGTG